ncbi:eukaryotic-type carbonic anhydrase domain-containing protein [Ditylenchus destructor]|nr:eukaryotic-type carbonic anhydrase domain-containing protein [Ditylenchus destructor]
MLSWMLMSAACLYPSCIMGPDFWGLVNKEWKMCRVGQLQSPINIDPALLLFDPHLSPLSIARHPVEASFRNTGQLPVVIINAEGNQSNSQAQSTSLPPYQPPKEPILQPVVNISGGPAFPYNYQLHQVVFHFGLSRSIQGEVPVGGSEHTVDRIRFPAEVQLFAFNSDLYDNFRPRGILAISVIVDIGEASNLELRRMTVASQTITYKDRETRLKKFHPANLLPKTDHYVTYEGSLTFPGCHETVTWVVMNKPIYITLEDQLDEKHAASMSAANNPLYMAQNYRPVKPTNGRLIRTNINVKYKSRTSSTTSCPSNIYLDMGYRFNLRRGGPPQNGEFCLDFVNKVSL